MAFYRTGGGGSAIETVLWTNGNPTSSFSAQLVTLNDSISNYDYLKFVFKVRNNIDENSSVIIETSEFVKLNNSGSGYLRALCSPSIVYGNYTVTRRANYVDDTSIRFDTANYINANGGNTSAAIPLEIIGIKL